MTPLEAISFRKRESEADFVREMYEASVKTKGITEIARYGAATEWFFKRWDCDWEQCVSKEKEIGR